MTDNVWGFNEDAIATLDPTDPSFAGALAQAGVTQETWLMMREHIKEAQARTGDEMKIEERIERIKSVLDRDDLLFIEKMQVLMRLTAIACAAVTGGAPSYFIASVAVAMDAIEDDWLRTQATMN